MGDFFKLLRRNRNYRYTWFGQVVSEIGDHFNTIAVFSLVLDRTGSGAVVSGVMLARAIPMILAGPIAGVALDRMDRKKLMIASDLVRGFFGLLFIGVVAYEPIWPIYVLSGALMFASPFFTSGRTAILPTIASEKELHAANSLTQTTKALTVSIGSMLGGLSVAGLGYKATFLINAMSFFFSGAMVTLLKVKEGFTAKRKALTEQDVAQPWREYKAGINYLRRKPLLLGIALLGCGWAVGGGAAQILFSLFGEVVFDRGATGIGFMWSAAGFGVLTGAVVAHEIGGKLKFEKYKKVVTACYVVHGLSYVMFSQAPSFGLAAIFVCLSRTGVGVSMTLNQAQLLRHVDDEYRGRVYSTIESMIWATMMLSLTVAGFASEFVSPRTIGTWAGAFGTLTALVWTWANLSGRLPEPTLDGIDPDEVEIRTQPRM